MSLTVLPTVTPEQSPSLMTVVDDLMRRLPILDNGYFQGLRDDSLSREDFVRSQRRFYFAVRYFPRPMAALMARMPVSAGRQGLMHNLSEEHGFVEGDGGEHGDDHGHGHGHGGRFDFRAAHDLTFLAFLGTLGIPAAEMQRQREEAAVRAFNTALMGTCLMERTELAFACLGVIEYAFADISALIGRQVVARGWIPQDRLVHYHLHAEIDKRHAVDFFRVVEGAWREGGGPAEAVEEGLRLGLYLFNRLYEDLAKPDPDPVPATATP
ncbi:MAG: PqqC-like protein [Verrucomicrobiales bacterium]|nr:PqqC-like protein [Verrucomicrobiales bacterium]